MERMNLAIDYAGEPQRMLLALVDIAESNPKLRRMWQRQYLRMTDEMKRRGSV